MRREWGGQNVQKIVHMVYGWPIIQNASHKLKMQNFMKQNSPTFCFFKRALIDQKYIRRFYLMKMFGTKQVLEFLSNIPMTTWHELSAEAHWDSNSQNVRRYAIKQSSKQSVGSSGTTMLDQTIYLQIWVLLIDNFESSIVKWCMAFLSKNFSEFGAYYTALVSTYITKNVQTIWLLAHHYT